MVKKGASQIPEITIILPCRNEENALPFCLKQIKETIKKNKLSAEIIVSDSSTDSSPEIAKQQEVILIKHDKEGYGNAYLEAFKHAKGKYIFMADADGTYDFREIPIFIKYLKEGNDLVIGNRFKGKIESGAMPKSHKYIGTPVLSFLSKLFFKTKIHDINSGMRAIKKDVLDKLNLQTAGMEFASEMIIKSLKNNLKIKELPINYKKRVGESKLRSFPDGWRHLRFMLLYSPLFLFFIPGIIMLLFGFESFLIFYLSNPNLFGIQLYYHPLFFSAALLIIGYQLIIFAAFSKIYSITHLKERNPFIENLFKFLTLEKAIILGLIIGLIGLSVYAYILAKWTSSGFGSLNEIKNSILALTATIIGLQTIFSSFMISILGIKEK